MEQPVKKLMRNTIESTQMTREYSKLILSVTTDNHEGFWVQHDLIWPKDSLHPEFTKGINEYLAREEIISPIMVFENAQNHNFFKTALAAIINLEIKYPVFDNSWVEGVTDFVIIQVQLARKYH